ncbi:MAG TPA: four helix bundle protein [Bacteroidia bacterium]|nr:four helix bundle protein [Bacteroidia bacterium]HRH09577.1 four helix bundle protein [Bacteroidia bacterium]
MAESFRSFQELECWKAARAVRLFVKEIIFSLPKSEQFDLIDNLRRAARSSTRNIAEGYGRFHFQENIQFCRISRGSMTEIWDDLITCLDEKYISEEKFNEGVKLIQNAIKVLNGYIYYLEKAKGNNIQSITKDPTESYKTLNNQ